MSKTEIKQTNQIDRFKETAKELGADESEAAFDEKLKKIAPEKPLKEDSKWQPEQAKSQK
jgi:hypothetical protein